MSRVRPIAPSRIKAAVKAAEDAGVRVGAVEVRPDGTIRMTAANETIAEEAAAAAKVRDDALDYGCCIYVMQAESGPIKIGISNDVYRRHGDFRIKSLETINVIFYAKCADRYTARAIESMVHKLFHEARIDGEWFDIEPHVGVSAIIEMSKKSGHELLDCVYENRN